jgi:quinol monooxygenase YgiN
MEFMGRSMVKMTAAVKIRPEKRKEFLDAMRSLQDDKLKEKGVTASKWHEDHQDPTRFYLIDEWETGEDLNRYRRTDSFRVFLGALKTLCIEVEVKYGPLDEEGQKKILGSFSSEEGGSGKM